ncbi:MAG: DUF3368 domain-containing protein [Candidatus Lokiarchaeota archaeon]|nr:DUF3368 domain-containing protein [Candidatus Lokiarchaeota archaeon]
MSVVTNATPLIYLAKIGKLLLLKKIYGRVIIPEEVRKEVVDKGKQLGEPDALIIEQAIKDGWLIVEKTKKSKLPVDIQAGEAAVLAIAKEKKIKEVIIDEISARTAAKIFGLTPKGTISILLKALAIKEITLEEFIDFLEKLLQHGFRLKEEIYLEAIKKAKKLDKEEKEEVE